MTEKSKDVLSMCIPPERLEVLQDIAERRARWVLGPETSRGEDATILWDPAYFTDEMIKEFERVFNLDPNIWCMTIRSKQGQSSIQHGRKYPLKYQL
ncbi:MAG TPA: hypothetical protein VMV48_13655 [Gallionellaceae bacterium]|nr:hypothetical protein [Gallionellaceae bacterium]